MHTIIRDVTTPKNDFTFFADRLNRLVGGQTGARGEGGRRARPGGVNGWVLFSNRDGGSQGGILTRAPRVC